MYLSLNFFIHHTSHLFYIDNHHCSTPVNPQYIIKRLYPDYNVNCELDDPHKAHSGFHSEFGKHYFNCVPEVKIKLKYSNRKPWLTIGLKTIK